MKLCVSKTLLLLVHRISCSSFYSHYRVFNHEHLSVILLWVWFRYAVVEVWDPLNQKGVNHKKFSIYLNILMFQILKLNKRVINITEQVLGLKNAIFTSDVNIYPLYPLLSRHECFTNEKDSCNYVTNYPTFILL
jgi:hypothetical protein